MRVFTTSISFWVRTTRVYCTNSHISHLIAEIISPVIEVTKLQPNELHAIHQVLLHVIRVNEKREFVGIET